MIPNGFYQNLNTFESSDLEFVCFGIPRSGSTLVYQLVSSVFPAGVAKTHQYCRHSVRTAVSFRDFRDVVVSLWRRSDSRNVRRKMRATEIDEFGAICLERITALDKYFERGGICSLRYEDFSRNPITIFSSLKRTFGIEVEADTMERLVAKYSMSRNKEISQRLSEFSEVDAATQIHGNHIYRGEIGSWRNFVDTEMGRRLEGLLRPALVRYGYLS